MSATLTNPEVLSLSLTDALDEYIRAKREATATILAYNDVAGHHEAALLSARAQSWTDAPRNRPDGTPYTAEGMKVLVEDHARALVVLESDDLTEARRARDNADSTLSIARERLRAVHAMIALATGVPAADRR